MLQNVSNNSNLNILDRHMFYIINQLKFFLLFFIIDIIIINLVVVRIVRLVMFWGHFAPFD